MLLWLIPLMQRNHQWLGAGVSRTFLFMLINVHILLLIFLLSIIIKQSIKLFFERKKGLPGSVFKRNLLFAFSLFSVIPAFFVFFAAGRIITKTIDAWFCARIEQGLLAGLTLHQEETKKMRHKLTNEGNRFLARVPQTITRSNKNLICIKKLITAYTKNNTTAYAWNKDGSMFCGSIGNEIKTWRTYRTFNDRTTKSLSQQFLHIIKTTQLPAAFDFYGSLYWVAQKEEILFVLVKRYPPAIRSSLIEIQNSLADYNQLKSLKNPIYLNYYCTFFLVMLLILFLSIWCAFYIARGLSKPIKELLDAVSSIRKGKLDIAITTKTSDDLRMLVEGFNEMVGAIKKAQTTLQDKHNELFTILENIKAAVFLINEYGRIIRCNEAAQTLAFHVTKSTQICDKRISIAGTHIVQTFFKALRNMTQILHKTCHTQEHIFTINGEDRSFVVTLSIVLINNIPTKKQYGTLVVLEDVTDVVKANKLKTWQEAAKQMAHEIKNPLTPIQLATQRLQRKFGKLLHHEESFIQSTQIILEQVSLIKNLVVHFSEFAKMPPIERQFTCLKTIISDVCNLYKLSYPAITITYKGPKKIDLMMLDEKKIKRVFFNLFDNSIRALREQNNACISITMKKDSIMHCYNITFSDNGPGIAQHIKDNLFFPYVSTEQKNMGLGLSIVRDIITLHNGSIETMPSTSGATFIIKLPYSR